MNNDQKLWRDMADEIGDIALPEPSDFQDPSFQRLAKGAIEDLEKLRKNVMFFSEFEDGERWLAQTMDESFAPTPSVEVHVTVTADEPKPETCPSCPHAPHFKGECIVGDEDCPCDAGPAIPEWAGQDDFGGTDYPESPTGADGCRDGSPAEELVQAYHENQAYDDTDADLPESIVDKAIATRLVGHDDVSEPPDRESYVTDCYYCGNLFDFGAELPRPGEKVWCGVCEQSTDEAPEELRDDNATVIGKSEAWLQGVEDHAVAHGLVAGKDYNPEHGIPGRDFDPKKEPYKLPESHPDFFPF